MKVLWAEDALRDIDDIADHLLEHHPGIAGKVGARAESAVAWSCPLAGGRSPRGRP
ncbi:MAG: hypothetical protein J0H08_06315 [Rhizobiales bacterium]|nr:hypothetical protein [Hyphomicrobiales bacterium]